MTEQPEAKHLISLISDLEAKLGVLTLALDAVRSSFTPLAKWRETLGRTDAEELTPGLSEAVPASELTEAPTKSGDMMPKYSGSVKPVPEQEADTAPELDPEEERREAVRRAVQAARADLAGADSFREQPEQTEPSQTSAAPELDPEEERREAVRRAVQAARADLAGADSFREQPEQTDLPQVSSSEASKNADDVREQVRRQVEAMKSEMNRAWPAPEPDAEYETVSHEDSVLPPLQRDGAELPLSLPTSGSGLASPIMIVMDDPDGRIELVKVYDTLARVNCSQFASLLNYSPHNIAISLGLQPMPDTESLREAVSLVFGRACEVEPEGERLSVRIQSDIAA